MEHLDIRAALEILRPGADWGWRGGDWDDYSQLDWRDKSRTKPTEAEIITAWNDANTNGVEVDGNPKTLTDWLKPTPPAQTKPVITIPK